MNIPALLTLRYDPTKPTAMRRLTPADFTPEPVANLEKEIMKRAKPKDKQATILLSGGMDSLFTLHAFKQTDAQIKTVCLGFNDESADEIKQAEEMARKYDVDFKPIIQEYVLQDLPKLINIVGEPRWNLWQYYALRECEGVVYTGDGGDELWAGYVWRYGAFLDHATNRPLGDAGLYLMTHNRDWVEDHPTLFAHPFRWREDISELILSNFNNDLSPVDKALMADFNGKLLYDWIPTGEAFAKTLNLTIKSLFLQPSMIKLATHTPWRLKYDGKEGKLPIRKILGYRGGKKGFSVNPWTVWEREGRELYHQLDRNSRIVQDKIINYEWIAKHREPANEAYINKMIQLVALEIWLNSSYNR